MYSVLANAVAVLHGILILALATGGAWILAGRGSATLRRAYIVLLGSLALSQVLLGECFLTGLEKNLRNADRPGSAYSGAFITHYVPFLPASLIFYSGLALGTVVVLRLVYDQCANRAPRLK